LILFYEISKAIINITQIADFCIDTSQGTIELAKPMELPLDALHSSIDARQIIDSVVKRGKFFVDTTDLVCDR